jgi:hypothetical protein
VREKTFPLAKFIQIGDPMVMSVVGDLIRKELDYSGMIGRVCQEI